MAIKSIIAACIACTTAAPAFADDSADRSITPTITVGFKFGADAKAKSALQFAAQFDVRSQFLHPDTLRAAMAGDDSVDVDGAMKGTSLVTLFDLTTTRHGVLGAQSLGHSWIAR
ncbi:MAG TPA: hypothetical protein VFB36_06480 [Nevskiaceae bacterium]|nr:hypothetical protein [Nevskiaceae bacterium]